MKDNVIFIYSWAFILRQDKTVMHVKVSFYSDQMILDEAYDQDESLIFNYV